MIRIACIMVLISLTIHLKSQKMDNDSIVEPFKIEDRVLSGLDIPPLKLKAHPERAYFQKRIYKGTDLSVYILSSETAINEITNFPIDEFVYYLNGRADIESGKEIKQSFFAGDYIFVPKGFSGKWTNNGGNKYHLELSVISNKRADSIAVSGAKVPFLLDRALMSGIGLSNLDTANYRNTLYSGVELDVFTASERPHQKEIINNKKEQFIHVLNGLVTITPHKGQAQTFYTGDFFILPEGFSGSWKSEGQNLFRTLIVTQI